MTRKWIVIPVVGFGLIAGSVGSYAAWTTNASTDSADGWSEEYGLGAELGQPGVQAFVRASARGREAAGQWLAAEVDYAARCNDVPRLLELYSSDAPYLENEQAALLTCRGLLLEESFAGFTHLRELWRGREVRPAAWLALDADALLRTGHSTEARVLLTARSFPGSEDAGRLARLALTTVAESEAFALMDRAEELAPGDADVRRCRGRLLESTGRPEAAAAEFAARLAAHGDDWVSRNQLAECYRRAGAYDKAVETWVPADGAPPADIAWLKGWFWNRVARPASRDWEANAPSSGSLQLLAASLLELPADQFWEESGHGVLSRAGGPPRQETHWLRLLALLQAGREDEAASALRNSPFRCVSWQPDLEDALVRILDFRAGRPQAPAAGSARPEFFEQLERLAAAGSLSAGASGLPDDLAKLLGGNEAFSAALLAAGWDEAALRLHHPETDLTRLPGWFNDRLTRAFRSNRSDLAALYFTLGQQRTPGIDFVAGELLVNAGRDAEALVRLRAAAAAADANAPRAARLLARTALRQGKPAEARRALEAHPRLADEAAGRMLLARAADAEGDGDRAEEIYRGLAGESAEARAYLARRAATGGDWSAASGLFGSFVRDGGR